MIDFLMILSSLILHEGGAKTSYSSSGEEALPSHSSNSHFGGVLAGLRFGRRVREAAQHENEQRVPTVEA